MINTKITKNVNQSSTEERLFKLLESIDWKLWEMYNMMKKELDSKTTSSKSSTRKVKNVEEV